MYLKESEIDRDLLCGLNHRESIVDPIGLDQRHNLASNRILITWCHS